jgi:hypothetical protein
MRQPFSNTGYSYGGNCPKGTVEKVPTRDSSAAYQFEVAEQACCG